MTGQQTKKFIALYLVPASVMADWAKTDPEIRQPRSKKCKPIGADGCTSMPA